MKLYYHPLSPYSQKVLIALYEKQVDFEPILVNLMSPEGQAKFAQVYPIGKIPLLKPSDDDMIPESTIIIEYLDRHYPDNTRLIPEGMDAARHVRFMDRMSDFYLNEPAVTLLFERFGFRKHSEEELAKADKYLRISYAQIDKRLASHDWLCGKFSMADCAAIPTLFYCEVVAPFSGYPHLTRYYGRARKRPSYAKVLAEFVPIWEDMQSRRAQT